MNRYTVRFTGTPIRCASLAKARVVHRTFRVNAPDTYTAQDLLNEKHNLRERFVHRCFQFGVTKPLISGAALARALNATPECEEQS